MANLETAYFGGGCFWCTEAVYSELKGVESVMPGYAGGNKHSPTYEEVCGGNTNHAEVIEIKFNPDVISYRTLLEVFFSTHDPTTPNRQGNDVGTQYRSIILYADDAQKKEAETFIEELIRDKTFAAPVVTEVKALETFYPAEAHHRKYYEMNKKAPYCEIVINPKLEKFQKKFAGLLKEEEKTR